MVCLWYALPFPASGGGMPSVSLDLLANLAASEDIVV
jgi:hypothetical protein